MAHADHAILAQRRRDLAVAARHWKAAAGLEARAAALTTDEPSRSILYRSAAWLAVHAGDLPRARTLARTGLAGHPSTDIAAELREVLADPRIVALDGAKPLRSPRSDRTPGG